jgi:hypothetical protein|tara:strand:- start:79 stop:231 length:153 start_codon:yes stop_codon:yes gene_type:complete
MKKDKTIKVSQVGAPIKTIEMTAPNKSQTVTVKGTKGMRADKLPVKATWY